MRCLPVCFVVSDVMRWTTLVRLYYPPLSVVPCCGVSRPLTPHLHTRGQLVEVQNATAAYIQLLIETLAARGKYLW
jgi:hypothetical protein